MVNKKLDLVEFKLDEKIGDLEAVSIVEDPAIEQVFQLFNSIKKEVFKQTSDRQEITGPVMIPDIPILRKDEDTQEYFNCYFSEQTVKDCASIFLRNNNHNKANFSHEQKFNDSIHVIESWIVTDPSNDKANTLGFKDIKKGSWFLTYKVDDEETWNYIKKSNFTGFSVEAFFSQFSKIKEVESIIESEESKKWKIMYSIIKSNMPDLEKDRLLNRLIRTIS